jgi:hypothetical protein
VSCECHCDGDHPTTKSVKPKFAYSVSLSHLHNTRLNSMSIFLDNRGQKEKKKKNSLPGSLSSAARHTSGTTDSRWIHERSFKISETRISTRIKRRQNCAARCSAAGDKNSPSLGKLERAECPHVSTCIEQIYPYISWSYPIISKLLKIPTSLL